MSDFNDVLYDPRIHTHTSCIEEVAGCDAVVLIVGSRYGGNAIPDALQKLDFDQILKESKSVELLKTKDNISVTQLEVLKAVEQGMPVFSFVDERVWHDHALYEKNKAKSIIDQIDFPSIQKKETAVFIFEFINFLRFRVRNNSVFTFSKTQDIEEILRRQWSGLLQRLINEQRRKSIEVARIDNLSTQLADLKAAILTTIGSADERKIAQGVVRFRRLVEFLRGLRLQNWDIIFQSDSLTWNALLQSVGIVEIIDAPENMRAKYSRIGPTNCLLIKSDKSFYEYRRPKEYLDELSLDWHAFMEYPPDSRRIIVEALHEMMGPPVLRYTAEPIDRFLNRLMLEAESNQDKSSNDSDD